MASAVRQQRVADRIRAELAELLEREAADPRLRLVTVTDVKVDRELSVAEVFVSTVAAPGVVLDERRREVIGALDHAAGFFRREIGRRIRLRTTPLLKFHWDPSPDRAEHLGQILDALKEAKPSRADQPAASADTETSE